MQQHQRRAAAPDAPDEAAVAAGGLDALRLGGDAFDESHGFFADDRHNPPRFIARTLIAGFAASD